MGSPIAVDARLESALPGPVTARIHALWDELADFGAHETDAALVHAMRVLSELAGAQRAFWLGRRPARERASIRSADGGSAASAENGPDAGGRTRCTGFRGSASTAGPPTR